MPADLLIPLCEPPSDPPTPTQREAGECVQRTEWRGLADWFDAWDEYNAARIEGPPGGPVLAPDDFWGTAVGDDLQFLSSGHSIPVDALATPLRGEVTSSSSLLPVSSTFLLGRVLVQGRRSTAETRGIGLSMIGGETFGRSFRAKGPASCLAPASYACDSAASNPKPSPGRENERNYGPISLPNVRDEHITHPIGFWRSARRFSKILKTAGKIRIETNQEDSILCR